MSRAHLTVLQVSDQIALVSVMLKVAFKQLELNAVKRAPGGGNKATSAEAKKRKLKKPPWQKLPLPRGEASASLC